MECTYRFFYLALIFMGRVVFEVLVCVSDFLKGARPVLMLNAES